MGTLVVVVAVREDVATPAVIGPAEDLAVAEGGELAAAAEADGGAFRSDDGVAVAPVVDAGATALLDARRSDRSAERVRTAVALGST